MQNTYNYTLLKKYTRPVEGDGIYYISFYSPHYLYLGEALSKDLKNAGVERVNVFVDAERRFMALVPSRDETGYKISNIGKYKSAQFTVAIRRIINALKIKSASRIRATWAGGNSAIEFAYEVQE